MSGSLAALKSYLEGERCLRVGRYFDAMAPLQRAVREDSTFALAYYRLAAAAAGSALPDSARETIERGYQYRDRLAEHDRLLFDAERAWLRGEATNADPYNAITRELPRLTLKPGFHLGDMLFLQSASGGAPPRNPGGAFERVLSYDPDHVASLVHLMRVAAMDGRHDEALNLSRKAWALSPGGDQALAHEAFVAFAEHDEAAIGRVLAALRQARAVTVGVAFSDVALYSGNPVGASRIGPPSSRWLVRPNCGRLPHRPRPHRPLAGRRGRTTALAHAEPLDYSQAIETRALFAALPFLPGCGRVSGPPRAARGWDASGVAPSTFPPNRCPQRAAFRPSRSIGVACSRSGRVTWSASPRALPLERWPGWRRAAAIVLSPPLSLGSAHSCRARPVEALAVLGGPHIDHWFSGHRRLTVSLVAYERFLRAELLQEVGRDAEALGWFGAMPSDRRTN